MIEFVKEEDLSGSYQSSLDYMRPLFKPFDEFERIARNRPHGSIPDHMPKVTDGTLAGLIQETPKRIIQQIPTAKVKSPDEWLDIVAGYILEEEILPNSDYVAELIQKCWALTSKAMTYGSQPAFVQFINRGDYYGTDFTLPYVKHVLLEQGKLSDKDSNVIWLRTFWQKNQIMQIINREGILAKRAEDRNEKYDGQWNIELLKQLVDKIETMDLEAMTPAEREKGGSKSAIELDHCFQRGIGSTFYTWAPAISSVVRRKKNPDPRGGVPLHYMYLNVDLSNPLGRGAVEMSGPLQNLIDSEMQAYQYMRSLMLDPPIKKWGNVKRNSMKFKPRAIWDMGATPGASDAQPVDISTTSIERFPENYGLMKSQILNLNNSLDTSVSAEAGNPGFSKTQAGVQAQESRLGVSDNYIRKQFEGTFQEIMETSLNLYFAERKGVQELALNKATADKLRKLPGVAESINEENKIRIDYDSETPRLKLRVDPTSSSVEDNAQQVEIIGGLLERIEASPMLTSLVPKDKIIAAFNSIVDASGVENPEKLKIETEDQVDENGQPVQNQNDVTPEMVAQMIQEAMAQQQPQTDPALEMIKALGLKFSELPTSTQNYVLQALEMPSDGDATGADKDRAIKQFDVAQKAAGKPDEELALEQAKLDAANATREAQAQQIPEEDKALAGVTA